MISNDGLSLGIDLKYFRMRIPRKTLQELGNPGFIQFMVNPSTKVIALRPVAGMSMPDQTCRVDWRQMNEKGYIEVKSKFFLQTLCAGIAGMTEGRSYKMFGMSIPSEGIVVFPLKSEGSVQ